MAEPFGITAGAVGIAHETSRIAVGGLAGRVWKHLLIRTAVQPIARLQQYHLPPVVQDDISYPSEIGKPRVQLHDDDLTTEARPWSGLARLREGNASVIIYAL
jgi:hypothetical protein